MSFIVITIDGPAGAGKGTLARHLAHIYQLAHLDTGLLYRAVAFKMIQEGQIPFDEEAAAKIAASLTAEDLRNRFLREETTGNAASRIALFPKVREALLDFQRHFAKNPPPEKQGVIMDGRDIGLVILPDAPCKIYVTASPEIRAQRRLKELHLNGIGGIYKAVLEDIKIRDARDQCRAISPLRPAEDALVIDTSALGIDEVVKKACLFVDSTYPEAHKNSNLSSE